MKKAETSLFRPFSILNAQAFDGAMAGMDDHQWSHPGLDSELDSWMASSWYQLPLQMVSFG